MCGASSEGGETSTWCGTGWTGQPAVWERGGTTLVAFGAYDHQLHLLNATDGSDHLPPFPTGDLIKGSVSVDPDGFPLLYVGSRDDYFRVVAFDRPELTELWKLWAYDVSPTRWNDDWDGSGLVIGDRLFEGGENGQFHVVRLRRGYDEQGRVTVDPQLEFHVPGWDDQLSGEFGGGAVSIENSVALRGGTAYFANSAGLVQGWDVGALDRAAVPARTFRFWRGDDTDASVLIDDLGMLYVASEYVLATARSQEVGQLMKLDPTRPDDPLVWSLPFHDTLPGGLWATPALYGDLVIAATNDGQLVGVERSTGRARWRKQLPGPTWQSPVVVDDVLLEGDCAGVLHAYDLSDPTVDPPELWQLELGGCIESTPAVWRGSIYVGTRAGRVFAIGDATDPQARPHVER
jgi:outer membrane protein assembly factor BamB